MNRVRVLTACMVLGTWCGLTALSSADDDKKDAKASTDKEFVTKASASGLAEVNLSELAARVAQKDAVKQFARHMIADHMRSNQELTQLANQRSVAMAQKMDEKHQKLHEKLQKLSGDKFDHAYMESMVADHEEAVKLFEKESKDGKDAAMKEWAGKLTPILKEHLKMAREVCKQTKGDKEKSKDDSDK